MDNAFATLNAFKELIDEKDDDIVEEYVVKMYLAVRLKPIIGNFGITKQRLNGIAEILTEKYFEEEYSLDLLINAVYNYINYNKKCPPDKLLSDDIVSLLEDYEKNNR